MSVLTALERPRWAVAGTDARYPRNLSELVESTPPVIRRRLDGRCQLIFAVPATQEMRTLLTARRVVLAAPPGEPESEWIISRTAEIAGPEGRASLAVECDSIRVIMGDVGVVERTTAGGNVVANLGGVNGRPVNYLATYVIPELAKKGVGWIELGTIDPGVQFDLTFDAATPLAVTQQVATEAGLEWTLRPDEPNDRYLLDMVRTVGGVVETVVAKEGHNILSLARQRNREKLFTAIRPVGLLPTGSDDRANIGYATWRVTGVTGDVVEVEAHNGGDGPILEDGQHVGRYLEAADGTFWEIEDSDFGDQSFTLETGGGASFAVLDDVMIVATDTGQLMTDLVSPSGVAQFGYVQGVSQGRDLGHRNWVRNPAFAQWPDQPDVLTVQLDGTQNSTTINFKSFPSSYVVAVDTYLLNGNGQSFRVTTGGTADGSGNVTLTVSPTISGADNTWFYWYEGPKTFPDPWDGTFFGAAWSRAGAINQACNIDGTVSSSGRIGLKNLPANFLIPGGSQIGTGRFALQDTTANASGLATVNVFPFASATDNAAVTITRPAISGVGKEAGTPVFLQGQSIRQNIQIRTLGPTETVTFVATFAGYVPVTGTIYDWSNTGTIGPRVQLQTSTGTPIQTGDPAELEFATANTIESATARLTRSIASGEYRWVVEPPRADGVTIFGGGGVWFLRSMMLYIGTETPPFVEGSAATRLFQEGNLALLASRQWPATYTARVAEIESAWGLPADSPALSVGNFIRLRSPSLDENTLLRITQIEFNPLDPSDKILTLDADPERITQIAARARPRAVFVNVDVTVDNDGRARETVLVSDTPPALVVGVERFVVPAGTEAPTTPTALAVAPITQFDLGG